jgi:hypothetical protein
VLVLTLYHRTIRAAAEAICRDGFRDATGTYLTASEYTGVWVSDRALDANEGVDGDYLLRITLDAEEADVAEFEWVEEGKSYREWLMPAALLNSRGRVEIIDEEDS